MIKAVGEYLREALEGTQLEHCETLLKEKDYYETSISVSALYD